MAKNKGMVHGTDEERGVSGGEERKKTECPFKSQEEFLEVSPPIELKIGNVTLVLPPKVFSTGSFGFGTSEKVSLVVAGKAVRLQGSINLVVVGSKEMPAKTPK